MAILIGIDIGTQGTKAAAFEADGTLLASAFEPSRLKRPQAGVVEEDPERQFGSVCRTIAACLRSGGIRTDAVAALGIDGQMAGVIGIGSDGRHVTPYDSWLDTRCGPLIERMLAQAGTRIVASTGGPPSFNHGPKMLWWKQERPAEFKRITAFVQPGAYVALRLCGLAGRDAFIDDTYLHFSGFADSVRRTWDDDLCRTFRFDRGRLPRIVKPQEIVGTIVPRAARACGLPPGIPVVAGCGDTAASLLACGATRPGICVDVAGTASVFAATTTEFRADVAGGVLSCARSVTSGLWHPYAYVNGGGLNLEWFRSLAAGIASGGRKTNAGPALAALDRLAAAVKPVDSLPLFVPHMAGRNSPPQPQLRGAWTGLTHEHGLAEMYRGVLEGVALEYAIYAEAIRGLAPAASLAELRVTGGGAASGLWNAIKADALGMPVRAVVGSHGAPAGAAIVAGWGVGLFASPDAAAKRWVALGAARMPTGKLAPLVARRLARYRELLSRLAHADHDGNTPRLRELGEDLA
ncbi:MAG: xylulose kinase [Planctomycetota bacterium]